MSNRKAQRRDKSFRRAENSIQQRLRRPGRSERYARKIARRRARRRAWQLILQGLCDTSPAPA